MNKPSFLKIMEHIDREELLSKLIMGIDISDIHEWLKSKYTGVKEAKLVISEKTLKSFKETYLDFYNLIQQDIANTKNALATNTTEDLELAVKNNSAYKDAMLKLANGEINVDRIMATMAINLETRLSQIFDVIQEDPRNINTRVDRMVREYADTIGNLLDKYHRWKEVPPPQQVVNNNITLQVVDQHITVFHDVIKDVLSQMDLETSLYFMEVFNERMAKLKMPEPNAHPTTEMKMAEAKILNETINKKLNETI